MLASSASALVFVMMIAMAFTAPIGTAMLRVPAGDPVVLTVMVIAMAFITPIGAAMLRVPAGDPVVLTVMMMIAMAFTVTPHGVSSQVVTRFINVE